MPDEIKVPETKPEPKPAKAKAAPAPKPPPEVVAAPVVDVPETKPEPGHPRCVRVVRNIKTNGNKGRLLFGQKGLYFDGEAKLLWEKHRDSVEAFEE